MIELPMSGFAGRGELKAKLTELIETKTTNEAMIINVFGPEGVGKSTLVVAVLEKYVKKEFIVDIDLHKNHLRFPENALFAIRQEIPEAYADHFALFDLLYLMRIERINGKIKIPPSKVFNHNSAVLEKVFEKYNCDSYFSRNVYKAVEDGILDEWFEMYARKSVMRMFQAQNQLNWESLITAFSQGVKEYKNKTGKDMIVVFENSDDIFEIDDSGNSWAVTLADRAQCGKFIYLSNKSLSPQKTGSQTYTLGLENFGSDDGMAYFDSIGISREPVILTVLENTKGNPALMSYCIETSDMIEERDGIEPTADIYEADPESIVALHMSNLKSEVATFAKVLSPLRLFNDDLFEVFRKEYVSSTDRRTLPIKVFTDLRFCERLGGGFYAVQQAYKTEVTKTLDPDTLENIHYLAYQFHVSKLNSNEDYLNFPLHLYEALHHGKQALDINGFIMWFRSVEKEFLSAEFFNMWLGVYEVVSEHVGAILGRTHEDAVSFADTLAYLYLKAGRPVDAESMMKQTLESFVEHFGKNTAETVPAVNKLASVYVQTGDIDAAEAMFKNGLTIRETALGREHADVADSLLRLANFYKSTDRKSLSLEFVERAHSILNKGKQVDDEASLEAEENMAELYAENKNMAKAVQIYKRVATLKKEKLGEYDKETIRTQGKYAESVLKNGQPDKAVKLFEDLLDKTAKTYGSKSKAAAGAINDLAFAYQKNKEYDKAEEMHKRALEIKNELYGDNHPSTATTVSNYAQLQYLTGNLSEAEMGYKKAAKVYETVLGKVHQKTALGFNNLGFLTSRMGHFEDAEKYYMDALESKKALGDDKSASFAATLNNLGEVMFRMGRKDEAKTYLEQALEIYKEVLGEEHKTTQTTMKNLAVVSK